MTPDLSRDDLGLPVAPAPPPRRVVSLVPSLTEAVAATAPGVLVGATDWCTHPADLEVARVRGTKNPDVEGVVALAPDLVLANAEENRVQDLDALRAAGLRVWVTSPETVDEGLASLARVAALLGHPEPGWLVAARAAWDAVPAPAARRRAAVPVWRKPWIWLGRSTFAGDVLRRLGVDHVLADHEERYPRVPLADLPPHDLAVLPDEPWVFSADDGPDAFPGVDVALVSGRHLTWYGPSLAEAPAVLAGQLAAAQRYERSSSG